MSTDMNEFLKPRSEMVPGLSQDDKTWGLLSHLSSFAGYIIPFGHIIGPVVVYFIKKDQSAFVADQAKEAINFQISVTIYAIVLAIVGFILSFVGIGFILWAVLALLPVAQAIFAILAAIKANGGEAYRYPASIKLIK